MSKGLPRSHDRQDAATRVEQSQLPTYTVATVPSAAAYTNCLIHVSDGAGGSPCVAISDGTDWKQVAIGGDIAAS